MEGFDQALWSRILLSCHTDNDYVNLCAALVPRKWWSYFFKDPIAVRKRVQRYTQHVVSVMGTQQWIFRDRLHRDDDLPAVIHANGVQMWFQHGKPHRDADRPACTDWNGTQNWWRNGKRHRDSNLPAVVSLFGYREWWNDGKKIRVKEF